MKYYPVCLDVNHRRCLVVGGGGVGTRKVKSLVECGARVKVVAVAASDELKKMAEAGDIELVERAYEPADLTHMFLVFGATSDITLNERIHREAEHRGILCNIADFPKGCNFILPAVVQRGDLQIAVSTAGKSPAFARSLRKKLENQFGEEYGDFLRLMGLVRDKLLAEEHAPEEHKPLFERLIAGDLPELMKERRNADIDRLLTEVLGGGFTTKDLEFEW